MTTWGTFLTELRTDLKDTGATPRWSSDLLYLYFTDAVRDYSAWFPKRIDRGALTLSGGSYPLPSGFVRVIDVESPLDTFLESRSKRRGVKFLSRTPARTYFVDGGNLYIHGDADSSGVWLTYHGLHEIPTDKDDTTFVITVPDVDLELLRLYCKAKAHEHLRSRQASLDRFKIGSGSRTDNPLTPEVGTLMDEYHAKIADRSPGGSVHLYRPGRLK